MTAREAKDNQLELEVKARLESLAVIDDFITESVMQWGIKEDEELQIRLAVNEACTNIIQYAYSGGSDESIVILFSMPGRDLEIEIRDWGKPFDPEAIPQPDTTSGLFERKVGGMGIFLMKNMMNDVKYVFHAGKYNELRMIKHIP
jgi:anti-sigma regulatory factor (Ser/Thr protein kinase)